MIKPTVAVEPKKDQLFPGPPKYHSLIASHPAEPHPTYQISLFSLENRNQLTIKSHLNLLKHYKPRTKTLGTTEEGQLNRQWIIYLSILIIGGLWNIHGKID